MPDQVITPSLFLFTQVGWLGLSPLLSPSLKPNQGLTHIIFEQVFYHHCPPWGHPCHTESSSWSVASKVKKSSEVRWKSGGVESEFEHLLGLKQKRSITSLLMMLMCSTCCASQQVLPIPGAHEHQVCVYGCKFIAAR
jgi:hypothetical protein